MLKETVVGGILLTALTLGIGMPPALTQEASAAKPASESAEPGHAYQLDFTVSEMEEGKKIGTSAVKAAMERDPGSGNGIDVLAIPVLAAPTLTVN